MKKAVDVFTNTFINGCVFNFKVNVSADFIAKPSYKFTSFSSYYHISCLIDLIKYKNLNSNPLAF